jgi:hypothetical protein
MPLFTNPWSNAIPADTQYANLLGSDIRQLRQDISDRMGIFCSDWQTNQNGLTLSAAVGGQTTKQINIHGSAFLGQGPGFTTIYPTPGSNGVSLTNTIAGGQVGYQLTCPLYLPPNVTLQNVYLTYSQAYATVFTFSFNSLSQTGAITTITSANSSGTVGNYQVLTLSLTNPAISSALFYFLAVNYPSATNQQNVSVILLTGVAINYTMATVVATI